MEVHISKILCMSNIASTTVIEKQKCMCAYTYEPGDNAESAKQAEPESSASRAGFAARCAERSVVWPLAPRAR